MSEMEMEILDPKLSTYKVLGYKKWRRLLYLQLQRTNPGRTTTLARTFIDNCDLNETMVHAWVQILEGLRNVFNEDWPELIHRLPQIMEDNFIDRLYSDAIQEEAKHSRVFLGPDKMSYGDLLLELISQGVTHSNQCSHCASPPKAFGDS